MRNLLIVGVEMLDFMKWIAASRSMALVRDGPPFPPAPIWDIGLAITYLATDQPTNQS